VTAVERKNTERDVITFRQLKELFHQRIHHILVTESPVQDRLVEHDGEPKRVVPGQYPLPGEPGLHPPPGHTGWYRINPLQVAVGSRSQPPTRSSEIVQVKPPPRAALCGDFRSWTRDAELAGLNSVGKDPPFLGAPVEHASRRLSGVAQNNHSVSLRNLDAFSGCAEARLAPGELS
jgi:hypothetical protein